MFSKFKRVGMWGKLFKKNKAGKNHLHGISKDTRLKWREIINQVKREPLSQKDTDALFMQLSQRIQSREASAQKGFLPGKLERPLGILRPAFGFAVVLLLILGGILFLYKGNIGTLVFKNSHIAQYKTIKVEYGQRSRVLLSDGSIIIADAGSEIRYPTVFSGTRDIYLKGEAYFQVAKDSRRPFIVHANQAIVKVYGTKFDVRAWDENPTVTVAVEEGKVSVANINDMNSVVFLTKNQVSHLNQQKPPTEAVTSDVYDHLGWMNYEIKFESATVNEVLAQLQRWYNFKYEIQDPLILQNRVSVHIFRTNVDDVLQVISLLTNSSIEKDSTTIRIIPKH